MRVISTTALALAIIFSMAQATVLPLDQRTSTEHHVKPAAFFLAGDSTTAVQLLSNDSKGGGWGTGFIKTLTNGAIGKNFGHNGATTASFVAGGDWAHVINAVKAAKDNYTSYVTIQVSAS
jgi:lysophospholipase L1-like esterase